MSRVERHAVLFFYGGVKGALHVVDGLRDKIQTELPVAEEVVEQACRQLLALGSLIRSLWGCTYHVCHSSRKQGSCAEGLHHERYLGLAIA